MTRIKTRLMPPAQDSVSAVWTQNVFRYHTMPRRKRAKAKRAAKLALLVPLAWAGYKAFSWLREN